jgi:hypothetical protein
VPDLPGRRRADFTADGRSFPIYCKGTGPAVTAIEFSGRSRGHATPTAHRQQTAVDAVLAFFAERLQLGPAL